MAIRLGQFLFRARSYTPLPFLAVILLFARPAPLSLATGYALMLAGEGLRLWSVGYTGFTTRTRNVGAAVLVTSGPYARTRNPIYLGNFILALGACVAFNAFMPWILIAFTALFTFQYHFIVRLEEETLKEKFGGLYARYVENVSRFIPSLRRYREPSAVAFNPRVAFSNEKNTFASMAVIVTLSLLYYCYGNPFLAWIKF